MTAVQLYAQQTILYMENDLISFEAVMNDQALEGKLGVAMITNAVAALDLFAWLLYQTLDQRTGNRELFNQLLSDARFFTPGMFVNIRVFYGLVRCGVVHQFYPKNIGITAHNSNAAFVQSEGRPYVNCLGVYRQTLEGLRRVENYIAGLSGVALEELDFKLDLRRRLDAAASEGAHLNIQDLPTL